MRRMLGATVLLALALVIGGGEAEAQEPRIRASVDTTAVTVGGRVLLTLVVEHDPSATVVWPDSLDVRPFEVLDAVAFPATQRDGRALSEVRLSLVAFELGELEIPSIEVHVVSADSVLTSLSTDPFGIGVETVGLDEGNEIREIHGPFSIALGMVSLLPWLLLGVGLLILGYWIYRRRQAEPASERGRVVLPGLPHEDAYAALDALEGAGLLEQGEIKEFHIRLSEIIRTYVEGQFEVFALEMTTPEVMVGLAACEFGDEITDEFASFFGRCDLVKFAKYVPDVEGCFEVLAAARRIVDETKPKPVLIEIDPSPEASEPVEALTGAEVD